MSFFSDLGNLLSGRNRQQLASEQLSIQQQIAEETLKQQIAQDELKYNPELAKQRTRQLTIVVISITLIIVFVIWIRNR